MVFSLFSRKSKPSRKGPNQGIRVVDSTIRGPSTAPTQDSTEVQRELARRTAEKIDQIESEMIAAALPTPPAPKRVQERMEARRQQDADRAPLAPDTLPPLEMQSGAFQPAKSAGNIQINDGHLAPELEEAAILFANGQPEPAAMALRSLLATGGELADSRLGWRMLFDVYQAMGQKGEFETLALEFAGRFELSPPAWQEAGGEHQATLASESKAPAPRAGAGLGLALPAAVDAQIERQLAMAARALSGKRAVTMDVNGVKSVTPEGATLLLGAIRSFKGKSSPLVINGANALLTALDPQVQPGQRDGGEDAWMLALEMLRLKDERHRFDDLSIDYCVTYEVSPPSWEPMPENVREPGAADAEVVNETVEEVAEAADDQTVGARGFEFRGEVVGRIQKELGALREHVRTRKQIIIDCRHLVRLDFVAAGELLNETVSLRAEGKDIVFLDVSAIVSALMSVMGIHELAEIRKRRI